MNISKVYRKCYGSFITKLGRAQSTASQSEVETEHLQKQETKTTKNVSGISIISTENYSPITHVSLLVKAGSRYESGNNLGITHCLRNSTALSSRNHTAFALTRHLEQQGSKLSVSSTREFMIYTLQSIRDDIDSTFPALVEIATKQAFRGWEVSDANPQMNVDLAVLNNDPEALLMEALHQAAFRGGLVNSPYSPKFMVGKHTAEMLQDYVSGHYVGHRIIVSALGISHDHLETKVTSLFDVPPFSDVKDLPSKFGGGEVRIEANTPVTRAAIVAEGASLTNMKDMLSLGVLQCILGNGPLAKYSLGEDTKIGAAAAKCTSHPFAVNSLNINYSDTGMFGVYIAGHPNDMKDMVKSVVNQMRESSKKVTDEEVQIAKHALKAKLLMEMDTSKELIETMAVDVAVLGQHRSTQDLQNAIDGLTTADVNAVACKVMKTRPAMAVHGPLHSTPYIDELL